MFQRIVLVTALTATLLLACGGKKSPNGPEGTTVISVLSDDSNVHIRAAKPAVSSAEWLTKNEAVGHFQVTQGGHAFFPTPQVNETTYQLKLQQAISGLANPPSFSVEVNADGLAVIRMIGKHGRGVSGYYRIFFVREVSGAVPDTLGRWASVPINGGKESNILLPLEQQAVILGAIKPGIDIVPPNGRYSVGALVNITWSVYGFVSEDTRVRIDLYLGDKITWVKNLATNHLIQLGITFETKDLEPNRVYVVKISTLAPPLVEAWSRDFDIVHGISATETFEKISVPKQKLSQGEMVLYRFKGQMPETGVFAFTVVGKGVHIRDWKLNAYYDSSFSVSVTDDLGPVAAFPTNVAVSDNTLDLVPNSELSDKLRRIPKDRTIYFELLGVVAQRDADAKLSVKFRNLDAEVFAATVPKLKVTLDASTPTSSKLKMGVINQMVTVLRIINLSERDMPLNGSGLRLYGDIPLKGVNKVTVWDGTIKVGEYIFPYNDRYSVGRFSQPLWIPGSSIKLLAVKVDLAPVNSVTARDFNGTTLAVNYDSQNPDNTWGVDPTSGQVIYADGSDYIHAPKHTVVAE